MACSLSLRTSLLTGSATGGTWTYNGFIPMADNMNDDYYNVGDCFETFPTNYDYNSTNVLQFSGGNAVNPPASLPVGLPIAGNTIAGGDNPSIEFDESTPGYYSLTYTVGIGSCFSAIDLVVPVFPTPQVGQNCNIPACSIDNQPLDLYLLWNNVLSGVGCGEGPSQCLAENNAWTSGNGLVVINAYDNNGTSFNITDDTFNPFGVSSGSYTFVFTKITSIPSAWTTSCPDCLKSATLTVQVYSSQSAGTPANIAVCN